MPRASRTPLTVLRGAGTIAAVAALPLASLPLAGGAAAGSTGTAALAAAATPPPASLQSTAIVSKKDVWAVGFAADGPNWTTFAEHGTGKKWKQVATPSPDGASNSYLRGVSAVSKKNVWAVGNWVRSSDGATLALVEHWNGKKWKVVRSPDPDGSSTTVLQAITAVSATDIWASGFFYDSMGETATLTEHYNGKKWTIIDTPALPTGGYNANLLGVSATSSTDVWAVGDYFDSSSAEVTLTEHWDGTAWTVVDSTDGDGSPDTELHGVTAVAPDDVWAVGFSWQGSLFVSYAEHWNGSSWTQESSADPNGSLDTYLYAISADSATDAWATGYYYDSGSYLTLTEHWDGTSWTVVDSPNQTGSQSNYLYSVVARSARNVWAVGNWFTGTDDAALVEHWNGKGWRIKRVH